MENNHNDNASVTQERYEPPREIRAFPHDLDDPKYGKYFPATGKTVGHDYILKSVYLEDTKHLREATKARNDLVDQINDLEKQLGVVDSDS